MMTIQVYIILHNSRNYFGGDGGRKNLLNSREADEKAA